MIERQVNVTVAGKGFEAFRPMRSLPDNFGSGSPWLVCSRNVEKIRCLGG